MERIWGSQDPKADEAGEISISQSGNQFSPNRRRIIDLQRFNRKGKKGLAKKIRKKHSTSSAKGARGTKETYFTSINEAEKGTRSLKDPKRESK